MLRTLARVLRPLWPAVFGLAVAAGAAPDEGLRGVDEKWRHVRSPNFEVYTHGRESDARELLKDFELLRALFLGRVKVEEREKLEVTVYQFRNDAEFRAYAPSRWGENLRFSGCYVRRPDRAAILLSLLTDEASRQVVFHEYAHHLIRSSELKPAVWFSEGVAELFSAIRVEGQKVEVGRPHENRIIMLSRETLLPLEMLFGADERMFSSGTSDHVGLFYAQSWALLHYWYFGDSKLPPGAVDKFIRAAGERVPPPSLDRRAFFRECFGMDYAEMERRLKNYVQGGRYRFSRQPAPTIAPPANYEARPVPLAEARLRLAELAVRVNASALGESALLEAAAHDTADARVFEALGLAALRKGDDARAAERWEQAVAMGTTNTAVHRELALLEGGSWLRRFDVHYRLPAETSKRLRERLLRAIEYGPHQSAPYEMLAWVEAYSDAPVASNVNRVQRQFARLRQQARTIVALALVRIRAGEREAGKAVLEELDKVEWDAWAAHAAESIRANLEQRPMRPVARPPLPNVTVEHRAAGQQPMLELPSVRLPPGS